jgi:excinuclease ABC subunit A
LLVIEHNLELIRCADWVIDLGPDAGDQGGRMVGQGTPAQLARIRNSSTGRALAAVPDAAAPA